MANSSQNSLDLEYADQLWQVADRHGGTIDAADYKRVVLGLLFLKYVSYSFESRRAKLKEELQQKALAEQHLENRDGYTTQRVFLGARGHPLAEPPESACPHDVAKLIDEAIYAVDRENPNLKNKLPRDYRVAGSSRLSCIDVNAGNGTGRYLRGSSADIIVQKQEPSVN